MKRALRDLEEDLEGNSLDTVPTEARSVIARLCEAFVARGQSVQDFRSICEDAGYSVPKSTLEHWRRNVNEGGDALPGGEQRGRSRALSEEQERLFVGWVYWKNVNNQIVQLQTCLDFLQEGFGVTMSTSTVHEYLQRNGFSSLKMKKKAAGYKLSVESLVKMAFEWLRKHWRLLTRGEIWSIDCTLTGHRTDTWRSYAPEGGPPPLLDASISRFTNLIVTAISSLGRFYHSILFTYNQDFRRDRNRTMRRDMILGHLDSVLQEYNVEDYRVVYIGKAKNETRTYVAASAEVIQMFLDKIQVDHGSVWLSDCGKEFFPSSGSIFENYGAIHQAYPSPVHQYLSGNDNNHHTAGKNSWRALKIDFSDDIKACVALMHCFDLDAPNIRGYFEANLQCGKSKPDIELVRELIGGKNLCSNSYLMDCMYDYCIAFKKDGRGVVDGDYDDRLDGLYWQ